MPPLPLKIILIISLCATFWKITKTLIIQKRVKIVLKPTPKSNHRFKSKQRVRPSVVPI